MKKPRSVNYINNRALYEEMKKFIAARNQAIEDGVQSPQISKYIGEAVMLIANKLSRKGNFSGYTFKDEMISDGIENCIQYLHNFNPNKSNNPFAYITLIIWRAYIRRIEKEAKHSYIRHKLMFNSPLVNGIGDFDKSDIDTIASAMESMSNEKSADIISKFEGKIADKKQKKQDKIDAALHLDQYKAESTSLGEGAA